MVMAERCSVLGGVNENGTSVTVVVAVQLCVY